MRWESSGFNLLVRIFANDGFAESYRTLVQNLSGYETLWDQYDMGLVLLRV